MSKKHLYESFVFQVNSLVESDEGPNKGRLVARGQFGKADIPTANRRIYPRHLWERELGVLLPRMKDNQIYGELDHPGDGTTKLQRVSHLITRAEITDDGLIIGEAVILPNTRNGKQLMGILKDGGKIGISSRGFGSVVQNDQGMDEVQDDFQLLTWDFVADPAASGSYPEFQMEDKKGKPTQQNVEERMKFGQKSNLQNEGIKTIKKENDENKSDEKAPETSSTETDKKEGEEVPVPEDRMEALVAKIRAEESRKAIGMVESLVKTQMEEMKDAIRSELQSDPKIAGAFLALEAVKQQLRPYILENDISEEIGRRDTQIESIMKESQAKDVQLKEYQEITKELGYKLKIEQAISEHQNKAEIRQRMGDVTRFESLKHLEAKLEQVLKSVQTQNNHFESKMKERDKVIESLKVKNRELESGLKKAVSLAEGYAIKVYAERASKGHAAEDRILKLVESRNLKKPDEVDSLIEEFKNFKTPGMSLRDKVRRSFKSESKSQNLVENQLKDTFPKDQERSGEKVLGGYSVEDIARMTDNVLK